MRVKEILKEKGLTGKELADKLGMTETGFSIAIGEKGNPPLKRLQDIAFALDVPITELFESKGDFVAFVHHEGETRHFNSPDSLAEYIRPMCKVIEK